MDQYSTETARVSGYVMDDSLPIAARVCFYNSQEQNESFWDGAERFGRARRTIVVNSMELDYLMKGRTPERDRRESIRGSARITLGDIIEVAYDRMDPMRFTFDIVETIEALQKDERDSFIVVDLTEATVEQAYAVNSLTAMIDAEVYRRRCGRVVRLPSMPRVVILGDQQTEMLSALAGKGRFVSEDLLGREGRGIPRLANSSSRARACAVNLTRLGLLDQDSMINRTPGRNPHTFEVNYDGRIMAVMNRRLVDGSPDRHRLTVKKVVE